jgi:hypothetical protein
MRRHLVTPLAALAVLSIMVAACGGSATAAPSAAVPSAAASVAPSVEPSPSPEASVSPAASAAADASGALPSIALPSFNADKDLEALLPSTFGGATLQKFSMKGAQFLGSNPDPTFNQAITALGLTAADVSVAIAADPTGKMDISFAAIRFAGADSGKLLQVFQAASQATGDLVGSVNVGGKDVIKTKDSSGSFSYFYVKNDTVLGVTAKTDAAAAPALQVLP